MAAESGPKNPALVRNSLEDRLFAEPYTFEFTQAVRLLRLLYPEREGVGLFHGPSREAVRFGVYPTLTFPASEIQELELRGGQPPLMRVNFMGTVGPLGLLPIYYTELVADRAMARDRALRDFLDLFHHRAISLFYRAWEKYRFLVPFEQGQNDTFSEYLRALVGLGTPGLQRRQNIPDQVLLYYSGLLGQQPRSAEALKLILSDHFGVPVNVEQFLGGWYRLEPEAQCNLRDPATDTQQLGFGSIVGDEIWDPQSRVRVVMGPLSLRQYLDFLPSGTAYRPLRAISRFFGGDEFDIEVQLILRRDQVPVCELGAEGATAPQLGWLTWSKTRELNDNANQTILQLWNSGDDELRRDSPRAPLESDATRKVTTV